MSVVSRALCVALVVAPLLTGCSKKARYVDPDGPSKVEGTGIEARDMRATAAQMAKDLVDSGFLDRWQGSTPPRMAVLPVENRTRFLIDAEIFTTLLTDYLIGDLAGKVGVLNRDLAAEIQRERSMKASGQVDGAISGAVAGADYFLEGRIQSLTASSSRAQTDYVVVRFQLTNASTSVIEWADTFEMKKEGRWGVMYQ